jgi:hypothetical protein
MKEKVCTIVAAAAVSLWIDRLCRNLRRLVSGRQLMIRLEGKVDC